MSITPPLPGIAPSTSEIWPSPHCHSSILLSTSKTKLDLKIQLQLVFITSFKTTHSCWSRSCVSITVRTHVTKLNHLKDSRSCACQVSYFIVLPIFPTVDCCEKMNWILSRIFFNIVILGRSCFIAVMAKGMGNAQIAYK